MSFNTLEMARGRGRPKKKVSSPTVNPLESERKMNLSSTTKGKQIENEEQVEANIEEEMVAP